MRLAYYIRKAGLAGDPEVMRLLGGLALKGCEIRAAEPGDTLSDVDMLLAVGGDGTFLSAARMAARTGVPMLGVNFGRLGFLAGIGVDEALEALVGGDFVIEERMMLAVDGMPQGCEWPYALNDVCLTRERASMLGVDVRIGGSALHTYWGDGVIVSTSSGSTAYSLSVGGPVCTPDARVLIVSPIAPHNLNLRPIVIPEDAPVTLTLHGGCDQARLSLDNAEYRFGSGSTLTVGPAPFRLKVARPSGSDFFRVLESRFQWGADLRNSDR